MSQPIRVAQVLGCMTGYGVERYVMNYYQYIDRNKIQFDIFAHEDSTKIPYEEIEKLGGHVFTVPPYQRLGEYLNELTFFFRKNKYQIVHSQIGTMSVFPLRAAEKAGVPVRIVHNHSAAAKDEWKKSILKYTLRPFAKVYATHYAAVSRSSAAWLFGRRSVEQGEVTIVNIAVRTELYKYNEAVRIQVRQELNIGDKFVVGHAGRFCFQKNHEFLIDIFRAVRERRPDAVLLLAGDGDTRDAIEKKIKKLGMTGSVLMLGSRSDVGRLYQAMDVFVLPSRYEGLPTVAIEAQLAGLKVVTSTRVTEETKVRSDMAFLDLSAGAERWAEEVLKADPDDRSLEGDFSLFDVSVQAERLEEYYCGLLSARKTERRF